MSRALTARLYQSAARAGLAVRCTRVLPEGERQTAFVSFSTADDPLLDQLASGEAMAITFAADAFPGLKAGEILVIDRVRYRVRDVHPIRDGGEQRARLSLAKR